MGRGGGYVGFVFVLWLVRFVNKIREVCRCGVFLFSLDCVLLLGCVEWIVVWKNLNFGKVVCDCLCSIFVVSLVLFFVSFVIDLIIFL